MAPLYPELHVRLRTANPLALVSAVRLGLRRCGVDPGLIRRFTEEALASEEPRHVRAVCEEWADVELPRH